jgi:hypothetical protein
MFALVIYLIILAALLAKLELMTEGQKSGWAMRLPCWRIDNCITRLLIGKELTGYHFWLLIMFLFMFHGAFLFISWNCAKELILLGLFLWFFIAEDFFWFLENDYYGLRNFKKGRIFWHRRWILGVPVSYMWSGILGAILIYAGVK